MPSSPRDVPPPVDLTGHLRDLSRALLPALLIAVLVGAAVFGLRTLLVPKEYAAVVIAEITPAQAPVPGDAFIEQMRAPFVGLAGDGDVLKQVLWEVDTGWDTAELRKHVQLSPGESPALLVFTVTARSPELAGQLARTIVINVARKAAANHATTVARELEGLQAAIAAEQARIGALAPEDPNRARAEERLAQLQGNIGALQNSSSDQLTVLAVPEQDSAPVAPRPVAEGLVAGVATLLVAAELLVWLRGRFGARPNRVWARKAAQKHRAQFGFGDSGMSGLSPSAVAAMARARQAHRPALILRGEAVSSPLWNGPESGDGSTWREVSLTDQWWRTMPAGTEAIVVVSTAGFDRKLADRTLTQLRDMATPTTLVLQISPRRRFKKARKVARSETADQSADSDAS
ncbi:hypothetical protein A5740_17275 [Mycobacterium sp. GA-1841]|nr:hypothetical protein A5740_17275 [Mycobacterium sp. GA-1841]